MPDDLALLTGPGARDLLAVALGRDDDQLLSWQVRHVDHRPGQGTTVAYDARVRGRDGERRQVLAASTGEHGPAVWRFPFDPSLPALPGALDEDVVRALLGSVGAGPAPVELRVRSYRPGRRAVVEVRAPDAHLFLKVVPPHAVDALHRRHVLLRAAGVPVPRSRGCSPDGLLVLEALTGTSLRARLREGGIPAVDAGLVLTMLDGLPPELCALPRRASWSDEVEHRAGVTAAALPSEAARCMQLAARVRATCRDDTATVPVHGDLHETQLLLDGSRVAGLLDVDTAGPGRRADDLACVLAHLAVLGRLEPASAGARALEERWRRRFERAVDPVDLRARVAGVLVALATGPHRVQSDGWQDLTRARLALAEDVLDGRMGLAPAGSVKGVIDR